METEYDPAGPGMTAEEEVGWRGSWRIASGGRALVGEIWDETLVGEAGCRSQI